MGTEWRTVLKRIDMGVFCDVGNIRKTMVAATSWGLRRRSSAGVIETVMR